MCPDLSTETFHLFSNTLLVVSYCVLAQALKVSADTHVWCQPAELAVSPFISTQSGLFAPQLIGSGDFNNNVCSAAAVPFKNIEALHHE